MLFSCSFLVLFLLLYVLVACWVCKEELVSTDNALNQAHTSLRSVLGDGGREFEGPDPRPKMVGLNLGLGSDA